MPNLILPTRALEVVKKGINLFHHGGFHTVGRGGSGNLNNTYK